MTLWPHAVAPSSLLLIGGLPVKAATFLLGKGNQILNNPLVKADFCSSPRFPHVLLACCVRVLVRVCGCVCRGVWLVCGCAGAGVCRCLCLCVCAGACALCAGRRGPAAAAPPAFLTSSCATVVVITPSFSSVNTQPPLV